MGNSTRIFWLLAGAMGVSLLAGPASANTATLKCNSSRDQIWVYDSLSSLNVDAKLKCGEDVEVVGRVRDYVKIRARSGVEGYVPAAEISNLPPIEPRRDSAQDVGLAAKQAQAKEIAKAAANAASLAPASVNYSTISPVSDSDVAAVAAPGTGARTRSTAVSIAPMDAFGALTPAPASRPAEPAPSSAPAATAIAPRTISTATRSPDNPPAELPAAGASTVPPTPAADSNPMPDRTLLSESADLNCQSYFSAYGLTPSQTKWIAQNREKAFSRICPAPDPSKVDFVIIFTHDVDFFSGTMPNPVHKSDGFSDFTAMTRFDTALIPESQADKARREYVWIFHFEKGSFDPASFSPRRKYQFSKMETSSMGSKAGVKTVEDAFRFVASTSR